MRSWLVCFTFVSADFYTQYLCKKKKKKKICKYSYYKIHAIFTFVELFYYIKNLMVEWVLL